LTALRAALGPGPDPAFHPSGGTRAGGSEKIARSGYELVVVGASLGGLAALRTLLGGLPRDFPAAVAIVQHRRPDADSPLAHLLGSISPLPVCEPTDREPIEPGTVYLAPPGYHMLVEREPGRPLPLEGRTGGAAERQQPHQRVPAGSGALGDRGGEIGVAANPGNGVASAAAARSPRVGTGWVTLSVEGPVSWARPSIDVLFESAAQAYRRRLAAVLLTGSSEDGAAGVEAVAQRGGLTVVEDPGSARSPVSPLAALQRTAVHHVLPLAEIAGFLREMVQVEARR
jgi:two-component system chemotaxis response regulator CheB